VERITDASADGRDPVHIHAAGVEADNADRRAVGIGGAPLAFDAQHPVVDLVVEAGLDATEDAAVVGMDLAAGHRANDLDPVLVTPQAADEAADVKAVPVVDDRRHLLDCICRRRSLDAQSEQAGYEQGSNRKPQGNPLRQAATQANLAPQPSAANYHWIKPG